MSQGRPTSFIDAPPSVESSSRPIVLFAATRWELAAVRRALPVERRIEIDGVSCFMGRQAGRPYWLVRTGIGPHAADAATAVLHRQATALAISAGFAGGLRPEAAVGDAIVATSVIAGKLDTAWSAVGPALACDDTARRGVLLAAAGIGLSVRSGLVLSVPTVLCRAADKQRLAGLTGAVALDMESAAIGKAAHEQGVPFAVVRTVSDTAGEDLPLDFNDFLAPWGWMRGIRAVMMTPSSLIRLIRFGRQTRQAADRLTALFACWADQDFGRSQSAHAGKA